MNHWFSEQLSFYISDGVALAALCQGPSSWLSELLNFSGKQGDAGKPTRRLGEITTKWRFLADWTMQNGGLTLRNAGFKSLSWFNHEKLWKVVGEAFFKGCRCFFLFFMCFFCDFLCFQSGALFLAICYILEQKRVLCWILELKFAICTVHPFFHGVHWFTQRFHRCFHSLHWVCHGFNCLVSIDFSMHNMHLVNM